MQLDSLKPNTPRTRARRIGRGGKRGKTSGRGGKGQTARSGSRMRPEWRDIIKRLPKRRGYGKHRAQSVVPTRIRPYGVSLTQINERFDAGSTVNPSELVTKKLAVTARGRLPVIKILGGTVSKKLSFEKVSVTAPARAAIEKAGGSIVA